MAASLVEMGFCSLRIFRNVKPNDFEILAAVVVVGSWFGVAVARENNDASMQEQWQAGYDSRNSEIAELEKDRQD